MSQFKPGNGAQAPPEQLPLAVRLPRLRPATSVVVPPTPVAAPGSSSPATIQRTSAVALIFTLIFVFLRFSFLHEFLMEKMGFDSHLLLIIGAVATLSALFTGGVARGITHRIAYAWIAFGLCMGLATAFSIWKGGSFAIYFPYIRTTLLLVVLIPAVAVTPKDLASTLKVVGLAAFIPIALGFFSHDYSSGRLELSGAGASIENSNDFAALLILVLPAIAYLTLRQGTNVVFKLVGLGAMGLSCYLILGTGSRGALISMIVSLLYVLKASSGKVRVGILVVLPTLALIAIPFLPGEAAQRLASLFVSKDQTEESAASQQQRTALLMASLEISIHHPLMGVGPGTFSIYQAQEAQGMGQRGMWHETHNSYTQVSSECGIPALICYLGAIGMTFLVFRRGMKSTDPITKGASQILSLMLVSFSVCMFFLSQAYGFGFPVLGGFAICVDRLLRQQAETATRAIS